MKNLLAISAVLLSLSAQATPINILDSWGVDTQYISQYTESPMKYYTPTDSSVQFSYGDWVGPGGRVGPGLGGQRYDLEALYVKQSGSLLEILGITGALWNTRGSKTFGIGDLFIGNRDSSGYFYGHGIELTDQQYLIDKDGFTTAAINTNNIGSLYEVSPGVGYSDGIKYTRTNDFLSAPGQLITVLNSDGYADGTPEFNASLVQSSFASIQWQTLGNNHSVFYASIPNTLSQWNSNIVVHWGEVCTNDYLEVKINTVPEPSSIFLVALGAIVSFMLS